MRARLVVGFLLAALLAPAAKKTVAEGKGENQDLVVSVTLYTSPDDVKQLLGDDLGGHYIVASVKVEPRFGKQVAISRDDFTLRTDKDGEKTQPFAPSQIVGRGALVVKETAGGGGIGMGSPSSYPGGLPPVLTGGQGMTMGSSGEGPAAVEASVRNAALDKLNPLEQTLKQKQLPEEKAAGPVSGLLYFCLEKQKVKDLELLYGGRENRISIRFKPVAP